MAGIIKNQILKHLSRFVKDLSSDRINVSTLKGEGELTNLELDQETLTELLALPIWMKIKKAHCNRARIMIQWTKLKSTPIRLILDTVAIQIEACEELRPIVTSPSGQLNLPSAGKYGFVNKVVDGITVTVESVEIRFFSKAFESKVQISRIRVESRSPQWKKADLTHTRLKDIEKGEVLTFKEIEWQTLRLEAQSTSERHLAPLRLLTNQARARVVLKKKMSDCSVVGCRLSLILDDLLWVLTDSQILAATHFMSSLSGLVKQATETSQHEKAARKLESLPEYQAQQTQAATSERLKQSDSARIFDAFDVKETSYHLMCEKIDLHFCDDPGGGRSSHPDLRDGGAAQVQLTQFMIDFYPYHLAKTGRQYWPKYSDNELSRWLKQSLNIFWTELMTVFCPKRGSCTSLNSQNVNSDRKYSEPNQQTAEATIGARLSQQVSKLMSTCLILKIRDVCLYKVTTSSREVPLPFLSSYLDRPKDISAVHMEFTWFYYPGGVVFPLPSPKLFTQIHPLQLHLDVCTILWLNSFVTNLQNCLPAPEIVDEPGYMDIRVEIIMPKVVFEDKASHPGQKDQPQSLQIQAARVIISNFRSSETGTIDQLAETLMMLEELDSDNADSFVEKPLLIPNKFTLHSKGLDTINDARQVKCSSYQEASYHLTTDMLWTRSRDVWFIAIDPVWADFCVELKAKNENGFEEGRRKFRSSTITSQVESVMRPFIDSLPVQLWLYVEEDKSDPVETKMTKQKKNIQAILNVDRICNVQLTHCNYLSLMRFVEAVSEISIFLTIDTRKTFKLPVLDDSVKIIGCLPRLEISFIMSQSSEAPDMQRDDASIFDLESTFPGPLNCEEDGHRQERTKEWSYRDEEKRQFYDAAVSESPKLIVSEQLEQELSDLCYNTPVVASMDSIKSSLTQGMKQGISSLVVSFSKGGGQSTPDSEVTSMWSTSDSSENNFVHLESPEDNLEEKGEENVEVAEEVVEEYSVGSFSLPNADAKTESEDVTVLTICLSGMRIGQNSEGLESSVSVRCRSLMLRELLSVPLNEFQTNFSTRSKKWKDRSKNKGATETDVGSRKNAINLRFSQSIDENKFKDCLTSSEMLDAISLLKNAKCPRVNILDRPAPDSPIRKAITTSTHPHLEVEIDLQNSKDEFITLHASTIKGLTEFLEDEIPPSIFPIKAYAVGVNLELIDEKLKPGMSSTKIRLRDKIAVTRDSMGVLTIGCGNVDVKPSNDGSQQSSGDAKGFTSHLNHSKSHIPYQENTLEEIQDLKQTIIDLQLEVTSLKAEKSHLLNELQTEKKQKRIITES